MQDMQGPQAAPVQHLLSARQVQSMLRVDRSTVYRMAEDGRLPAIRVGRQWRFPAHRIDALLDQADGLPAPLRDPVKPVVAQQVPPDHELATAVVQVAADLLGVMAVVTDMDGRALTPVANPCPWFTARADDPELLTACTAQWQTLADAVDLKPRFATGTLGFQCARAFVRRGDRLVGMVLVGGIAPPELPDGTADGLYVLDPPARHAVLAALPRVAAALSRVALRANGTHDPAYAANGRSV